MDRSPKETWSKSTATTEEKPRPQLRPNFSGDYALDRDASKLEGGAASARGARLRIDHHEPMIRIDAKFEFFDKTFAWSMHRAVDGREVADHSDPLSRSSLRWDDDALLFTVRGDRANAATTTWRYELADGGSRLRAVEQIRGGGRDQDNIWVFERR